MKLIPPPPQDFAVYIGKSGTLYGEREASELATVIYTNGYLPYSGAAGLQNIFYTARSARVVLQAFSLSSENRRIAKKFDGQFKKERIAASHFVPSDAFFEFCCTYFAQKHGEKSMPKERLHTILTSSLISTIITYTKDATPVAYVLEVEDGPMGHFWFSFYDLSYSRQSLGLWLMLDCIRDAKERGLTHYYLGTVYGEKALYKTNFEPLEWWDGKQWSADIRSLKELGRAD